MPVTVAAKPGQSFQITPTVYDQTVDVMTGVTVTYMSSAPLIATVNNAGLVQCLNVGTAIITVTAGAVNDTVTANISAATPTTMIVSTSAPQ